MHDLDKILEYINKSTMILLINKSNNKDSKIILFNLYEYLYNKYDGDKCICKPKGFLKKISILKDKLIRIDTDLDKIQFSSSNNNFRIANDIRTIQLNLLDNSCKIIFKTSNTNISSMYFYTFDLIITVNDKVCNILKNRYSYEPNNNFNIEFLRRRAKLKRLNIINRNN